MAADIGINIWINEERYEKLKEAGLADMAEEVLAGMKRIQIKCTEEQKDEILKKYPCLLYTSPSPRD